jgi:hypothetical protein
MLFSLVYVLLLWTHTIILSEPYRGHRMENRLCRVEWIPR